MQRKKTQRKFIKLSHALEVAADCTAVFTLRKATELHVHVGRVQFSECSLDW